MTKYTLKKTSHAWRRLAVCIRNVAIYITRDYIVRQTKNLAFIFKYTLYDLWIYNTCGYLQVAWCVSTEQWEKPCGLINQSISNIFLRVDSCPASRWVCLKEVRARAQVMGSWYDLELIARSGTERQRCLSGAHQHEHLSLFESTLFWSRPFYRN